MSGADVRCRCVVSGVVYQNLGEELVVEEPTCPWCCEPVALEGATCGIDCYALWYGWQATRGDLVVVTPSGRLVSLADSESPPLDMMLQPWYEREVGKLLLDRHIGLAYHALMESSP